MSVIFDEMGTQSKEEQISQSKNDFVFSLLVEMLLRYAFLFSLLYEEY